MKILIAPDKFKGSLNAREVADAIASGLLSQSNECSIVKQPMADGGEGSLYLIAALDCATIRELVVSDPLFRPVKASYVIHNSIAYIEMAKASGLGLLSTAERDCTRASSYGTGQLIQDAIQHGISEVVLFVGGSATNDLGIGMATALGYRFLNTHRFEVLPVGNSMEAIRSINKGDAGELIGDIKFTVVTDVDNVLYGHYGAAYMYAGQKGAAAKDLLLLDNGLRSLSNVIAKDLGIDISEIHGSGAAGGIGGGAVAFLGASIVSGADFFDKLLGLREKIKDFDLVITGEGQLDEQSLRGKVVGGMIQRCQDANTRCVVLCGKNDLPANPGDNVEIHEIMSVAPTEADAMEGAAKYLKELARQIQLTYN